MSTYNFSDQLSAHFNVQEFRCKCGQNHTILIADELVDKLEMLFEKLDCSKIIVTSGYRCPEHDKAVGGSGSGQHVSGNAADICCYDKNNQPISSKIVCCTAQDVGFTGIANITSEYLYTHVDVRTGSVWFGDETVNYHTVTNDFYQYFGIQKEGNFMNGIDASKHNGSIDWQKVQSDGIQFAILRAGYGKLSTQKDSRFEEFYTGAAAAGVPVGAYWYSYATTVAEAQQEAEACISVIQGKQFAFPIYFDLEEQTALATGKANCSAMIQTFCKALENAGYWAGLYMSRSALQDYTTDEIQKAYALWVAEWSNKCNYTGNGTVGLWQKSAAGSVAGISGNVDLDTCYVDYPTFMKNAGLNGFAQTVETPVENTNEITATIQIDGKTYSGTLEEQS